MTRLIVSGASDRGNARAENEDHFMIGSLVENRGSLTVTMIAAGSLMTNYGLLACVADGMGGYGGGAAASEIALRALAASYYQSPRTGADAARLADDVRAACGAAQRAVVGLQRSEGLENAGTTLAGVSFLAPDVLCVFHVGDSRVLRAAGGMLRSLTVDHTPLGEKVAAGTITEEQAVATDTTHLLTRSLGSAHPEVDVGAERDWTSRDVFLLGSDGWHGLGRGATKDMIRGRLAERLSDGRLSTALLQDALRVDGEDNATVVTVTFDEDPDGDG